MSAKNQKDKPMSYEDMLLESMIAPDNNKAEDENDAGTPTHRPLDFNTFIGQQHIKGTLNLLIQSAKNRDMPLSHILFYGPAGLGKTTLAGIISKQMGGKLQIINAGAIQSTMDLLNALADIDFGDIMFIDEIHRLPIQCQEILYEAMEDFVVTVPGSKTSAPIRANIPEFTLIGATTLMGDISKPMLDRFVVKLELQPYSIEELAEMTITKGIAMGIDIDPDASIEIAQRCRGTARFVTNYLRISRDIGSGIGLCEINKKVTDTVFKMLQVDKLGLESKDYRYLEALSQDSPMGLKAISLNLNESDTTVEKLIEPYLQKLGLIERKPRGRVLTDRGMKYRANKHNNF